MNREATIERKTKETEIFLRLNLDSGAPSRVDTGIPFMDHMLDLMSAHGFLEMELKARGDREIDDHHTMEDLGITLGMALKTSLGDKRGIRRYGEATIPMDDVLARVVIDISNRPLLAFRVSLEKTTTGTFDTGLIKEFFRALVTHAGLTLHIDLLSGDEPHHVSEAIFKAFGRALDQAVGIETRLRGNLPSTKGVL
ncbi:MAG: imidazoleglycerol-phosphate dehydratase HisB [Deltaproteobacteria bacterium]|nr:imidazoleglycerol-phosphate dehydratase HisB [Deltaproteobacteria bacterium]